MPWYFKVCLNFFRESILISTLIPIARLVSQLFLLAAFLLPLKILILLGNSNIPNYFPSFFRLVEYEKLILYLAVSTVFLYAMHLLLDVLLGWLIKKQAVAVIHKKSKLVIYSNQNEIIEKAFRCYADSTAGSMFVVAAVVIGLIIYPRNVLLLLTFSIFVGGFIWLAGGWYDKSGSFFKGDLLFLVNLFGGALFFISFAFMIHDFFNDNAPGILVAIVTLILVRQVITHIRSISASVSSMFLMKNNIQRLLFDDYTAVHQGVDLGEDGGDKKTFQRKVIKKIVDKCLKEGEKVSRVSWLQSGVLDVNCFSVTLENSSREFFVRCYDPKRFVLAKNEEHLLTAVSNLPAFELLHFQESDGVLYHIFADIEGERPLEEDKTLWGAKLYSELLLCCAPPESLIQQYRRTHPLLWQRMDAALLVGILGTLDTVSSDCELAVNWWSENFDRVRIRLSELPLCLVNVSLSRDCLIRIPSGRILSSYWGEWSIDCVGAGWPVHSDYLELLISSLRAYELMRNDLRGTYIGDVCLAALVFKIDYFCRRKHYNSAAELLPLVCQYFKNRGETLR